jgi:hypothetical protein
LPVRTRFRRYRGRRVPFSWFALSDLFSTVPRASDPVFMFCPPELVFGGTEGVVSPFQVLRSWSHFRLYRGRRIPFSCFARPDSFFGVPEGVGSRFHVLRVRTRFRRYRGPRVQFSCFVRPDLFSAITRASGHVFMYCAPEFFFGGTEGVGSRFLFLRARIRFRRYQRGRVTFSCFALPDSFSGVPRATGLVFLYCAPGFFFGGTEVVGSRFLFLCARIRFRRYQRGRVTFSCFALPDTFSAVPRAWGPVFVFCAPELVFGGTMGVGSRFNALHARIRFRWYRVHRR